MLPAFSIPALFTEVLLTTFLQGSLKRKRAMPICQARHSVQREELNYYVEIMP